MERGVKVVGGVPDEPADDSHSDETSETPATSETPSEGPPPRPAARRPGGAASGPGRRAFRIVAVVAALGLIGTVLFGVLYATKSSSRTRPGPRGQERRRTSS